MASPRLFRFAGRISEYLSDSSAPLLFAGVGQGREPVALNSLAVSECRDEEHIHSAIAPEHVQYLLQAFVHKRNRADLNPSRGLGF